MSWWGIIGLSVGPEFSETLTFKECPSAAPGVPNPLQPQTDQWPLSLFSAGLCLNCWSLQELVSRDPGHFLILLEQILQKTREVRASQGLKSRAGIGLVESRKRSSQMVSSRVPGTPKGLAKALRICEFSVLVVLVDRRFLGRDVVLQWEHVICEPGSWV